MVLSPNGGDARDPRVNTMFQVSIVDERVIHWVNGDDVNKNISSAPSNG